MAYIIYSVVLAGAGYMALNSALTSIGLHLAGV